MSGQSVIHAKFDGYLGPFRLDIDLTMPLTGVTVITGPSGSGKTSLLRCMAGLERLRGVLKIGDDVWQDATTFRPPHLRDIGMVFQEARLLPHLSVMDNLEFGDRRTHASPRFRKEEVVDLLGLSSLLPRHPHGLSG